MLDIISVILGIASIAQNSINQRETRSKTEDILKIMHELDKFFTVLEEAKKIHDSFESFSLAAMTQLNQITQKASMQNEEIYENEVKSFERNTNRFLSTSDFSFSFLKISATTADEIKKIPLPIQLNTRYLINTIIIIEKLLPEFEESKQKIISYATDKDYGARFKAAITYTDHYANLILDAADKIILNSIPIISYTHQKIQDILKANNSINLIQANNPL